MITAETFPRRWARVAGAFYLLTIVMGVFAELFVRGTIVVRDDAVATAANILGHESFYRLGLVADLIMLVCYVAVTLLFYYLFKPVSRSLSLLAALFSLIGIAVLAVNCLSHVAPLIFLGNANYLSAFDPHQLQALALASLRLHARGYTISGLFFGIYMLLLGYLIFEAGFLPRIVGVLMAIGGLANVIDSFATFLSPAFAARLPDLGMLGGIAELAFTVWLLAMGVNAAKWTAKAGTQPRERF